MGALQPDLPSPIMIPQNWHLTIIDLKDYFFTIPLHLGAAPKIAFTAKLSHSFFHQNAAALCRTFALKRLQAKDIIAACPDCQHHN
ncbi:POK7 protein, partial [Hylia prasina]|nr:POK7 protein [Hylia prasina]